MTLGKRRFLFYSLVVLFVLAGAGIVLYSQGWRINIDIKNCKIERLKDCEIKFQKTGAIYIETEPRNVIIKIGNKTFSDKTNILQKGTLFSNLPPKNYKIEIKKDGYEPYFKNLQVKPSMVSELLNVILIPKKIKEEITAASKLKGDVFTDKSNDDKKIIIKDSIKEIYRLYDLTDLSSALNLNAAFNNIKKENINRIVFHPFDSNRFIVKTKNGIYSLDINRIKLETLIQPSPAAWTVGNPNIYYIKRTKKQQLTTYNYALVSFNLVVKAETELFKLPSDIKEITKLEISDSQNIIALLNNAGGLYIFNQSNRNFKQIAHNAKDFIFSPDNKKIAFIDKNGRITVYFLEDYRKGFDKKAGDAIRFDLENKAAIENIYWYKDSSHLFIKYPDRIEFMEIDDRSPLNLYNILNGTFQTFYSRGENKLYYIRQNSLYFIRI